jgi:DNA-binding transcriptional regulator of glucitol operon
LPRHVLAVIVIAALSLLGRWQWDVSYSERGSLQNLLYAFQWWVMAAMVGYAWWRLLHDDAHGRTPHIAVKTTTTADDAAWPTTDPAASMPANTTLEPDDELDEYNAYLAQLNARSERVR